MDETCRSSWCAQRATLMQDTFHGIFGKARGLKLIWTFNYNKTSKILPILSIGCFRCFLCWHRWLMKSNTISSGHTRLSQYPVELKTKKIFQTQIKYEAELKWQKTNPAPLLWHDKNADGFPSGSAASRPSISRLHGKFRPTSEAVSKDYWLAGHEPFLTHFALNLFGI